jgi:hypothetical protein
MKRVILALGIVALLVLAVAGFAVASESYVISDYRGASQRDGLTLVEHGHNWTYAPENPNIVYIAVWAPNPYKPCIVHAVSNVVRKRGLIPVVTNDVLKFDLNGRLVLVYVPITGRRDALIYEEISLSGILYYSYAGDAKSAIETINNGLEFSESAISKSAEELCRASMNRLIQLRIANQTCGVAYWWNLRAKVGVLSKANPYEMVASEMARQLDQFLSDEP